jgi:hypothetical protein
MGATEQDKQRAQARRAVLAGLGLCINGGKHGPATHGKLCESCRNKHSDRNAPPRRTPLKLKVRRLRGRVETIVPVSSSWALS